MGTKEHFSMSGVTGFDNVKLTLENKDGGTKSGCLFKRAY